MAAPGFCASHLTVEWRIGEDGLCHIFVNGEKFGDALAVVADGFHAHDIYHFIFEEKLGWSHVVNHFLCGEALSDRLLLQEEAVVLNCFMPLKDGVMADCSWALAMLDFGQGFTLEEVTETMEVCHLEFRRLVAEIDMRMSAIREYDIGNHRPENLQAWAEKHRRK